jgi:hypothetical protein
MLTKHILYEARYSYFTNGLFLYGCIRNKATFNNIQVIDQFYYMAMNCYEPTNTSGERQLLHMSPNTI